MQLNRVVCEWSGGGVVGRAVTVLHYAGDVGAPNAATIVSAFQQLAPIIPAGVVVTIPGSGDIINDTNGQLTGTWTSAGGGPAVMNGLNTSAAGVGGCITWKTGQVVHGRRLQGRTFIVPLHTDAYDSSGLIKASAKTTLGSFANALQASGPLAVWHRPTTKGGSDGTSYGVSSNRVMSKVATLRSRRY